MFFAPCAFPFRRSEACLAISLHAPALPAGRRVRRPYKRRCVQRMWGTARLGPDRSDSVAVQELDRDPFRRTQEGDAHSRPHGRRLARELGSLGLELGNDRIDAADRETEMIEALIGCGGWRIDAIAGG